MTTERYLTKKPKGSKYSHAITKLRTREAAAKTAAKLKKHGYKNIKLAQEDGKEIIDRIPFS